MYKNALMLAFCALLACSKQETALQPDPQPPIGGENPQPPIPDEGGTPQPPAEDGHLFALLPQTRYASFFPYRHGYNLQTGQRDSDFYAYAQLQQAYNLLKHIELHIYKRQDATVGLIHYTYKVVRKDLSSGQTASLVVGGDYNAEWNLAKPEVLAHTVRFSDFVNNGSQTANAQELCAWLANISHETTGAGGPIPAHQGGLYWNEELGYAGTSLVGYVSPNHPDFPAVPGKSYHGRGPKQLSWNYNYGLYSFVRYGDKQVLLANPHKVLDNGAEAFASAIYFWMFPEGVKPSCHQVVNTDRGFAKTINIINGGIECGSGHTLPQVQSRIRYYKHYADAYGIAYPSDAALSCADIRPY